MSRSGLIALAAAGCLLVLIGQLVPDRQRPELSLGTNGTGPYGYRAVFDLLSELGFPVTRSYAAAGELPPGETMWWIDPPGLCDAREDSPDPGSWPAAPWVQAGGTAMLFLSASAEDSAACTLLEGVVLPHRVAEAPAVHGRGPHGDLEGTAHQVSGDLVAEPRTIEISTLATFADAGDWKVRAVAAERPLVLERTLGKGRMVAVADAGLLRNAWLDRRDAAPFAVDLVRAFGTPHFHEGEGAPRTQPSAAAYLMTSPALLVFGGLALTGLLFAWQGTLVPQRALAGETGVTPSLEAFVDSLATLYAGARDHGRVLERYRELTAARLRRHFGMPPETPLSALAERLACDRRIAPEALRLLVAGAPAAGERGLRDAVRALDALVREAAA